MSNIIKTHLKKKAILLIKTGKYSLDEISSLLNQNRSIVSKWIKDIPIKKYSNCVGRSNRYIMSRKMVGKLTSQRYAAKREEYRFAAKKNSRALLMNRNIRDMVIVWLCEGNRKNIHSIDIANSNPVIIKMCAKALRRMTRKDLHGTLQYHKDQNPLKLISFWSSLINIPKKNIRVIRKSNSGNLSGRKWASIHGVFSLKIHNTELLETVKVLSDNVLKDFQRSVG